MPRLCAATTRSRKIEKKPTRSSLPPQVSTLTKKNPKHKRSSTTSPHSSKTAAMAPPQLLLRALSTAPTAHDDSNDLRSSSSSIQTTVFTQNKASDYNSACCSAFVFEAVTEVAITGASPNVLNGVYTFKVPLPFKHCTCDVAPPSPPFSIRLVHIL